MSSESDVEEYQDFDDEEVEIIINATDITIDWKTEKMAQQKLFDQLSEDDIIGTLEALHFSGRLDVYLQAIRSLSRNIPPHEHVPVLDDIFKVGAESQHTNTDRMSHSMKEALRAFNTGRNPKYEEACKILEEHLRAVPSTTSKNGVVKAVEDMDVLAKSVATDADSAPSYETFRITKGTLFQAIKYLPESVDRRHSFAFLREAEATREPFRLNDYIEQFRRLAQGVAVTVYVHRLALDEDGDLTDYANGVVETVESSAEDTVPSRVTIALKEPLYMAIADGPITRVVLTERIGNFSCIAESSRVNDLHASVPVTDPMVTVTLCNKLIDLYETNPDVTTLYNEVSKYTLTSCMKEDIVFYINRKLASLKEDAVTPLDVKTLKPQPRYRKLDLNAKADIPYEMEEVHRDVRDATLINLISITGDVGMSLATTNDQVGQTLDLDNEILAKIQRSTIFYQSVQTALAETGVDLKATDVAKILLSAYTNLVNSNKLLSHLNTAVRKFKVKLVGSNMEVAIAQDTANTALRAYRAAMTSSNILPVEEDPNALNNILRPVYSRLTPNGSPAVLESINMLKKKHEDVYARLVPIMVYATLKRVFELRSLPPQALAKASSLRAASGISDNTTFDRAIEIMYSDVLVMENENSYQLGLTQVAVKTAPTRSVTRGAISKYTHLMKNSPVFDKLNNGTELPEGVMRFAVKREGATTFNQPSDYGDIDFHRDVVKVDVKTEPVDNERRQVPKAVEVSVRVKLQHLLPAFTKYKSAYNADKYLKIMAILQKEGPVDHGVLSSATRDIVNSLGSDQVFATVYEAVTDGSRNVLIAAKTFPRAMEYWTITFVTKMMLGYTRDMTSNNLVERYRKRAGVSDNTANVLANHMKGLSEVSRTVTFAVGNKYNNAVISKEVIGPLLKYLSIGQVFREPVSIEDAREAMLLTLVYCSAIISLFTSAF